MQIKELYKKFLKAKGADIKYRNLAAGKKMDVSKKGLWDKKKRQVIVPSNRITMKGPNGEQDFFKKPVVATGLQSGQRVMMQPGGEYYFPNDKAVHEVRMQDGGSVVINKPTEQPELNKEAMTGLMKSKIAYADAFNNPTGARMTNRDPRAYTFTKKDEETGGAPQGSEGNVYMGSYGEYATPQIQNVNGKLQYMAEPYSPENAARSEAQSIKFNSPEEAQYFAEHYKEVAPMMNVWRGSSKKGMQVGGVRRPIYTLDTSNWKQSSLDSLKLYNAYQFQKNNTIIKTGPQFVDGALNLHPNSYKPIKDTNAAYKILLNKKKKQDEQQHAAMNRGDYNNPIFKNAVDYDNLVLHTPIDLKEMKEREQFSPFGSPSNYEQNKKIINYYRSIGIPDKNINFYNSPDVFDPKIKPISEYFDGQAWSPVYKKPVGVQKKPEIIPDVVETPLPIAPIEQPVKKIGYNKPIIQQFNYMSNENKAKALQKYGSVGDIPFQGVDINQLKDGGWLNKYQVGGRRPILSLDNDQLNKVRSFGYIPNLSDDYLQNVRSSDMSNVYNQEYQPDIEKYEPFKITKKRSLWDKIAGTYRNVTGKYDKLKDSEEFKNAQLNSEIRNTFKDYDPQFRDSLNWTLDYMNSPNYKKNLMKSVKADINRNDYYSDEEYNQEVKDRFLYSQENRLSNLQTIPDVKPFDINIDHTGSVAWSESDTGQIRTEPSSINAEEISKYNYINSYVYPHEISHSVDRPNNNNPQPGEGWDDREIPKKDLKEMSSRLKIVPTSDYDKYLADPTEVRARLNATRRDFFDRGIDVFTKPINIKDVKNKNEAPIGIEDLQRIYKDEDILWMLNNISKNEEPKLNIAKYGGWLDQFQTGGELPVVIDSLFSNFQSGIGKKYAQQGMAVPGINGTVVANTNAPIDSEKRKMFDEGGWNNWAPKVDKPYMRTSPAGNAGYSDNTKVSTPDLANRKAAEAAQYARKVGSVTQGKVKSDYEKAREATSFVSQAEQRKGSADPLDHVLDMVNPASLAFAATDLVGNTGSAVSNVAQGNFKEAGSDLLNAGFNALQVIPAASELRGPLKSASKYLTTNTALKNTYKYNPLAFKPNPESYYRVMPDAGAEDLINSGFVRPAEGSPTSYFNKGVPLDIRRARTFGTDTREAYHGYKGPYMVESNNPKAFDPWLQFPEPSLKFYQTKAPIPSSDIKLYKEDWLQGYKQIKKPGLKKGGEIDNDDDKDMVNGVASILRRVKDKDNRQDLAKQLSKQFDREKVRYNLSDFLNKSKVKK